MINTVLLLRLGYATAIVFLAGWSVAAQLKLVASASWASTDAIVSHFAVPSNETKEKSVAENRDGDTGTSTNRGTTFSIATEPRPFQWHFLDITKMGACGMRKCFFYSVNNETSTSATSSVQEGYIVARHSAKDAKYDYLDRMMRTWNVTKQLEREKGIRHFLLEPPQKLRPPSPHVLKRINALAMQGSKAVDDFYGNGTSHSLVVQRVQVAPSPALIPRCYFTPKGRGGRFFFDGNSGSKKDFHAASSTVGKSRFMRTFQEELRDLVALVRNETRLWNDFQFLIDSEARIHHIDLDRIEQSGYTAPTEKAFDNCFGSIIGHVTRILHGDRSEISTKERKGKKEKKKKRKKK